MKNFKSEEKFLQTCNDINHKYGEDWYTMRTKDNNARFKQFFNFFKFVCQHQDPSNKMKVTRAHSTQYVFFVFLTKYRNELNSILDTLNIITPKETEKVLAPEVAYDQAYEDYKVEGLFNAAQKLANNLHSIVFTATLSNDKTIMIAFNNDCIINDKKFLKHIDEQPILSNNIPCNGSEFDYFTYFE